MAAGTGTDAAIGAADLTLVSGDPAAIADAIELARATMTVIRANLAWAFGYNVIAIPLAALGYLNPLFAGDRHVRQLADRRRQQPAAAPVHPAGGPCRVEGGRAGDRRRAAAAAAGRGWLGELARSAAGPVICGTVLTGLLAAWAAAGGAGTLTRVRLEVTVAAVPMRAFTPRAAAAAGAAHTYLAIRNLTGTPDELIAVRSPIARHVVLVRRDGPGSPPVVVRGLTVPARRNPEPQPAHRRRGA